MVKTIKPSKRAKLKLLPEEVQQLKDYVADKDNAPYATIKENTSIAYKTVNSIIATGSAERDTAFKMRDFLSQLRNA